MRRFSLLALCGLLLAVVLVWGQAIRAPQPVSRTQFEVTALYPRETQPGVYQQVDKGMVDMLSDQGWELVSTMPYIYRNEEHDNGQMHGPKPVVTQTYPAYFFKRVKLVR